MISTVCYYLACIRVDMSKVTSIILIFVITGDKIGVLLVSPQGQPMAMFPCPSQI